MSNSDFNTIQFTIDLAFRNFTVTKTKKVSPNDLKQIYFEVVTALNYPLPPKDTIDYLLEDENYHGIQDQNTFLFDILKTKMKDRNNFLLEFDKAFKQASGGDSEFVKSENLEPIFIQICKFYGIQNIPDEGQIKTVALGLDTKREMKIDYENLKAYFSNILRM